ncbi:MAG: RnfABCDGE type electron transport complex subunit G [Actinobacteria bacterium]|nr:RnfABCDGE type electron transport complex subunit G [Actinomycetota bacterium]
MTGKIIGLGLRLMFVGLIASVCLGLTYGVTRDKIREQELKQELESCMSVLPGVKNSSELKEDRKMREKARKVTGSVQKVYSSDKGHVFIVKAKGYGGPITLAVGIGTDGKITCVSVVSHNETPGLGGNIEKDEFRKQFNGMGGSDKFIVGETIEAITGATISSKAVTGEVADALKAYKAVTD